MLMLVRNVFAATAGYREYIRGNLTDPLIAGQCYYFEMQVSKGEVVNMAISNLGALFTVSGTVSTGSPGPIIATPQVSNNGGIISNETGWTTIKGTFTAAGGEKFVTLGNFNSASTTTFSYVHSYNNADLAYYYFDNTFLVPLSVNAGSDVSIVCGSSTTLNATSTTCSSCNGAISGYSYTWSPSSGLSSSTIANPIAHPNVTTTYTVTIHYPEGCTSTDNVTVTVLPLPAPVILGAGTACVGELIHYSISGYSTNYTYSFILLPFPLPGFPSIGTISNFNASNGTFDVTWNSSGFISVTLTNNTTGCISEEGFLGVTAINCCGGPIPTATLAGLTNGLPYSVDSNITVAGNVTLQNVTLGISSIITSPTTITVNSGTLTLYQHLL